MIRPLLLEAPKAPRPSLPARARAFFMARWPGRIVAAAFAVWLLDGLLSLAGLRPARVPDACRPPSCCWLFLAWLAWRALRWLADRLLWRIRTKLIVSYLFIALVPVVLLTLFMAVAGVLLLGLTASRVVTAEVERTGDVLLATARAALAGPARERRRGGARCCRRGSRPARAAAPGPRLHAAARRAGRREPRATAPRALPAWLSGPVLQGPGAARAAMASTAGRGAARGVAGAGRGARGRAARRHRLPGRDRAADHDPRARARRDAGRGARRAGERARRALRAPDPERDRDRGRATAGSRPRTRPGCCSWPCPTGPPWETGETGALAGTPVGDPVRPAAARPAARPDPAAEGRERPQRPRPAALRARHRGQRVRRDVRCRARARADAGALDHARRARALASAPRSCARATSRT